jgi:cellulase
VLTQLQQFYPECAQLNIINGGSLEPTSSELVTFPGAYSSSDPGLSVNIYSGSTSTTYAIPGPALYAGARGGSSPAPGTTTRAPVTSTTARPVTSTTTTRPAATTTASTGGGATAPMYGQCGGKGWTGPTTCAAGTCKVSSEYYSQCM